MVAPTAPSGTAREARPREVAPQLVRISRRWACALSPFPPPTLLEPEAPPAPGSSLSRKECAATAISGHTQGLQSELDGSAVQDPGPEAPGAAESLERLAGPGARVPSLCAHPSTRHHGHLRALGLTFSGLAERFPGREGGDGGWREARVLSGRAAVGRSGSPPSPAVAALCNSEQGLPLWASVSPSQCAVLLLQHHHHGNDQHHPVGRHCAELSGKTLRAEVLSTGACCP